ncbi:flavodoxin [Lacrimispora indolis]|uniref:flavodoxin n=1 Tax=Lacrimispora indolis TaxID=69825 RepID=UPI0004108423|nr:flavodoxin [[Clostridium] methoxybenzovorans]
MKRVGKLVITVFVLIVLTVSTAFAAGWTTGQAENSSRWWYDLGNGQYYGTPGQTVEWQWLDGNGDGTAECYAFDSEGWMYAGGQTPDGYSVNRDGAWTENGVVRTMTVAAGYAGTMAGSQGTEPDKESKILIAYFSKTGSTEAAARKIQAVAGGDLFEITVADTYPSGYQDTVDRARRELDNNARPVLSSAVENMSDYDVILLGYPIWWHTAPMAVNTFLESYDLTDKIILPFCTSGGSDIEESMPDIRRSGSGATVRTGLTANSLSREQITDWLTYNGLK